MDSKQSKHSQIKSPDFLNLMCMPRSVSISLWPEMGGNSFHIKGHIQPSLILSEPDQWNSPVGERRSLSTHLFLKISDNKQQVSFQKYLAVLSAYPCVMCKITEASCPVFFPHLILYLLLHYFDVAWKAMGEVVINGKSSKSYQNTFKSLKIYAKVV